MFATVTLAVFAAREMVAHEKAASVEDSIRHAELVQSIWDILVFYAPPMGLATRCHATGEERLKFLSEESRILHSQTSNPALLEDKVSLDLWRQAMLWANSATGPTSDPVATCMKFGQIVSDDIAVVRQRIVLGDYSSERDSKGRHAGKHETASSASVPILEHF